MGKYAMSLSGNMHNRTVHLLLLSQFQGSKSKYGVGAGITVMCI